MHSIGRACNAVEIVGKQVNNIFRAFSKGFAMYYETLYISREIRISCFLFVIPVDYQCWLIT